MTEKTAEEAIDGLSDRELLDALLERSWQHESLEGEDSLPSASLLEELVERDPSLLDEWLSRVELRGETDLAADRLDLDAVRRVSRLEADLATVEARLAEREQESLTTADAFLAGEISLARARRDELDTRESAPLLKDERERLSSSLEGLDRELRMRRAFRLLAEPWEGSSPDALAARLSRAASIRAALFESREDSRAWELFDEVDAHRRVLHQHLDDKLLELTAEERARQLDRLAKDMIDHIDDVLSMLEEHSLAGSIQVCGDEKEDVEHLLSLLHQNPEVPGAQRHRRRLRRRQRRLKNEIEERKVQQNLERRFGRRAVSALETMVLILIGCVFVILFAEWTLDISPEWRHILLSLDAGICAVFLIEYLAKVTASPTPLRYARRHFLLDFLPSIPFGLILNMTGLDVARSARAARLIRLPRLARYLRAARPFVKVFRLLGFLLRGMDRLARQHAALLNVNVLLFESVHHQEGESLPFLPRLRAVSRRWRDQWASRLGELEEPDELEALRFRLGLAASLPSPKITPREAFVDSTKEISFPALVEVLATLDATRVRLHLGTASASRVRTFLRYLDLPLIRHIPFFGRFGKGTADLDPCEATARAGRLLGQSLGRLLENARMVGDLWGVITAPRLLDRLGSTLSKATKRHAFRLIIFGSLFLLSQLLLSALEIEFLRKATTFLIKFLGTPILVLGGLCLLIYHFGRWIQKLAGEATDTYRKVTEAQFINLLNQSKRQRSDADLERLYRRVLSCGDDETKTHKGVVSLREHFHLEYDPRDVDLDEARRDPEAIKDWVDHERILLLYRDYLDGAVLHRSNVKTSEQLLGNLTMRTLREDRLEVTNKERHRLAKLDLNRKSSLSLGPQVWFHSITASLAEQTAKLLLDYNRNAIAAKELSRASETEISRFREWLGEEAPSIDRRIENPEGKTTGTHRLNTTHFTALNFLTADAHRDLIVEAEFGSSVLGRLRRDRRSMIRYVFGHYPYHRISKPDRTLNPYTLYWQYVGGGRILVLPFRALKGFFVGVARLFGMMGRSIRSLISSQTSTEALEEASTTFEVAHRKIARMRRPLVMECLSLRARFDPEFLGCRIPSLPAPSSQLASWEDDLRFVRARPSERRAYEILRGRYQARLEKLQRYLEQNPLDLNPQTREASLQCLGVAYAIDYKNLRTLLTLRMDLQEIFTTAIERRGRARFDERLSLLGQVAARLPILSSRSRRGLDLALSTLFDNLSSRDRLACRMYLRQDIRRLRERLGLLLDCGGFETAEERALQCVQDIVDHPSLWRRQLLTVRTLQTLSIFDVRDDRRIVEQLAELTRP